MMNPRTPRGVVLIEALVALLVVAFGMVAMLGLQANLRRSSDLSRQRTEALRLAQQDMETLRAFSTLEKDDTSPGNARAYAQITSERRVITPDQSGGNTDFTRDRTVSTFGERLQSIRTVVSWRDRAGESQSVALDSLIAGIDPSLSGALTLAPTPSPLGRPAGSNTLLPAGGKDLGDGRSVYKPLAGGTVAWIFNNRTGAITSVCAVPMGSTSASLTTADLNSCQDDLNGYLLSGVVRFSWAAPPDSENPAGPAIPVGISVVLTSKNHPLMPSFSCHTDSPVAPDPGRGLISYSCIVHPNGDAKPIWSGYVDLSGLNFTGTNAVKVCRYSADYDGDKLIGNAEHPPLYSAVSGALRNQNFLVIKASEDCPAGHGVDPAQGHFRNTATALHQSAATPSHGS